jgi:PAS domain S-box-containing protein
MPASKVSQRGAHFLDAQAVAQLGSWEINLATGAASVSPEMRRIFGWTGLGEADLTQICELAHPDDRARVEQWLERDETRRPRTAGCFFRIVGPDSTIRTLYGQSAVLPARAGLPARICGTVQDVTEQVTAERAINEAAHLYRDIFEHCSWGVFQTTADRSYLTANPALARIYGYEIPQELLSRLTDIGGQLYVESGRRAEFVAAMRDRGQVDGFESQVYRRDGSIIWIAETCREVRTSTGRLLYYEGTVRDVTARKKTETELRQAKAAADAANQELERRVEERTTELNAMQGELLQRERLSTLGELTATVAHELRNPLSVIRNAVYVIRGMAGEAGHRLDRSVQRIDRSIARCDRTISDLLDYAHARELKSRIVRIDEWLGQLLDEQALPEDVVVERRLGASDALVELDPDRFRCVVVNLLENAVQAMAEQRGSSSERRITVATFASETVEILVEDSGPGIAPDILPKVFDPLFSTKTFGTGLGLPTVKQIVEQHGGLVMLRSVVGSGTSVQLHLPRVNEANLAAAS